MDILDKFDWHFPSHLTGFLKPDPESFRNVIIETGYSPSEILFIDDNRLNVDAAISEGIESHLCKGLENTVRMLKQLEILE